MSHGHPLDRYIGDAYPDLEDPRAVAAFERIPYDERIAAQSLKAAGTKVLVTLGPMAGTEIWDKSQQVRRLVPSLERVLQVLGPGDERDGVYSFDALVDRYPAEVLTSKRQIEGRELAAYF